LGVRVPSLMRVLPYICLGLLVSCGGAPATSSRHDALSTPSPASTPARVFDEEADVGLMYWATPMPILCKDWYLVVGGTVLETHEEAGHGAHPDPFISGTLAVERIFLNLPTRNYAVSQGLKRFKAEGFDGLRRGDKVIVFANEYDGGYGIIAVPDSNCKIGIKVAGWDEPIVGAVEEMIRRERSENNGAIRAEMLKDARYAEIWRPYSSKGIAYLLEGKECWP
jgi:hypothetical protein